MNNPEYCQNIYDAAKDLIDYYDSCNALTVDFHEICLRILRLKGALSGKPIGDTRGLINHVRHLHD